MINVPFAVLYLCTQNNSSRLRGQGLHWIFSDVESVQPVPMVTWITIWFEWMLFIQFFNIKMVVFDKYKYFKEISSCHSEIVEESFSVPLLKSRYLLMKCGVVGKRREIHS